MRGFDPMASFGEAGAATYDVPRGDEARPRPACSSWPVMIARLWAKPGGDQIWVVQGDMADVLVSGSYGLVFLVFNTFLQPAHSGPPGPLL
jgi:hypothetical protein